MLSEQEQTTVWEGWLASEIRANYFADLSSRYQRLQRLLTWIILVASSGAVVTLLLENLPPPWRWLRPALALVTAAVSLWLQLSQYQQKAIDGSDLHFEWRMLAQSYQRLWRRSYAANAERQLDELADRTAELSKRSDKLPNRPKLMAKWQDHVEHMHGVGHAA